MERLIKILKKVVKEKDCEILKRHGGGEFYALNLVKGCPVLLMAHVDIAGGREGEVKKINEYIYKCIGADDRLGVAIIEYLKEKGYKFSYLLTNFEESGGLGAEMVTKIENKSKFKDIRLIIGLDRRGSSHYVSYLESDKDYGEFLEKVGLFDENIGSYSDCKDISKWIGVWHINIAIGYHNEHTYREYFNIKEVEYAIYVVENILRNAQSVPKTGLKEDLSIYKWMDYSWSGYKKYYTQRRK